MTDIVNARCAKCGRPPQVKAEGKEPVVLVRMYEMYLCGDCFITQKNKIDKQGQETWLKE